MTKRNLWLVSLLIVFGLGVMAPGALAQAPPAPEGTVVSVSTVPYTLRDNSIADSLGPLFLTMTTGYGIIAGGESISITLQNKALTFVGASGSPSAISSLPQAVAAYDFCGDGTSGIPFCESMTYTASGNTLTLTNGATAITGWTAGTYVTIYGLRVSAVGQVPGAAINVAVVAALNREYPLTFSSTGSPTSGPVTVGQVSTITTVLAGVAPTNILSCVGVEASQQSITVDVAENWAGAWTSLNDELTLAPFAPSATSQVTNGSDMSFTFTDVPPGLTIAPASIPYVNVPDTDPQVWTLSPTSPTTFTGAVGSTTVTFDYQLSMDDTTAKEETVFKFDVSATTAFPANTPPAVAIANLDPMTPAPGEYPAFTYAPGTGEPNTPANAVSFIGCQTNLLFPYVTNYTAGAAAGPEGNWDTALAIANTTSDPFSYNSQWPTTTGYWPAGATPQVGSCTFYVYTGFAVAGTTPTAAEGSYVSWTSPVVPSGGIYAVMLSNTNAKGSTGGYAIATCNFLNAVGYAETVNNYGIGSYQVLGSYMAYVIPNGYYEPRSLDAILGEFAITHFDQYGWYGFGGYHNALPTAAPSVKGKPALSPVRTH